MGFGGKKKQRVNFVVLTDGLENASTDYTQKDIIALVQEKEKKQGWAFTYLADDLDSWAQGGKISMDATNTGCFHGSAVRGFAMAACSNITYTSSGGKRQRNLVSVTEEEDE
jgi:hypothetical protein